MKSQGAFTITSNLRDDRQNLAEGEIIYVNGGSEQGIKVGDRFLVLKVVGRKFVHPLQPKNKLGDILQQVGIVRITTAQAKGSVAIIERCMDSVQKGDHLVRFIEPANIPLQLRTDITDPVKIAANSGVVIWSRDHHMNTANGDMAIIDKGAEDGLKVGDVLLAARTTTFSVGSDGQKKPPMDTTTHYLAQVLVVKTEAKTATCRVLRSNEELRIGDTITR
jgi:hypothetical protein